MDCINLTDKQNNLTSNAYVFDAKGANSFCFDVLKDQLSSLIITNIADDFVLDFKMNENSNLKLSFLLLKPANIQINGEIAENSTLTCYCADFIKSNANLSTNINLNGKESRCNWNLASLAKDNDNKKFDVSIFHNSKRTFSEINNYGVSRDNSRLAFSGICHIKHGSSESIAHQNAKIMTFDENSNGIAKPILKIDDNDIEASHAAVVGKISDDHLFYLTSRGLSLTEARELITYGYLKPILNGFDDEALQKEIGELIERGL